MAAQGYGTDISLVAAATLAAFIGVKVDSAGKAAVPGAGGQVVGVVQNGGTAGVASGAMATVRVDGATKMIAAGTIASGAAVTVDASGKAVAATTGNFILGVALVGGVANDIIEVLLVSGGKV